MRIHLTTLFIVTTTACATAGPVPSPAGQASAPDPSPPAAESSRAIRFPRVLPELSMGLVDVHTYEDPRLGSRLAYMRREPGVRVDVYVYPLAPASVEVPDSIRQRLVKEMFDQAVAEIREYERRGTYSGVRFSEAERIRLPSRIGPVEGWGSSAEMKIEGDPVKSQVYVFTLANTYVKFRSSYPRESSDEIDPIVEAFMAAFLAEADPGAEVPGSPAT